MQKHIHQPFFVLYIHQHSYSSSSYRWVPSYDRVDGTHVAVLCGAFRGVSLDAQESRSKERKYKTRK